MWKCIGVILFYLLLEVPLSSPKEVKLGKHDEAEAEPILTTKEFSENHVLSSVLNQNELNQKLEEEHRKKYEKDPWNNFGHSISSKYLVRKRPNRDYSSDKYHTKSSLDFFSDGSKLKLSGKSDADIKSVHNIQYVEGGNETGTDEKYNYEDNFLQKSEISNTGITFQGQLDEITEIPLEKISQSNKEQSKNNDNQISASSLKQFENSEEASLNIKVSASANESNVIFFPDYESAPKLVKKQKYTSSENENLEWKKTSEENNINLSGKKKQSSNEETNLDKTDSSMSSQSQQSKSGGSDSDESADIKFEQREKAKETKSDKSKDSNEKNKKSSKKKKQSSKEETYLDKSDSSMSGESKQSKFGESDSDDSTDNKSEQRQKSKETKSDKSKDSKEKNKISSKKKKPSSNKEKNSDKSDSLMSGESEQSKSGESDSDNSADIESEQREKSKQNKSVESKDSKEKNKISSKEKKQSSNEETNSNKADSLMSGESEQSKSGESNSDDSADIKFEQREKSKDTKSDISKDSKERNKISSKKKKQSSNEEANSDKSDSSLSGESEKSKSGESDSADSANTKSEETDKSIETNSDKSKDSELNENSKEVVTTQRASSTLSYVNGKESDSEVKLPDCEDVETEEVFSGEFIYPNPKENVRKINLKFEVVHKSTISMVLEHEDVIKWSITQAMESLKNEMEELFQLASDTQREAQEDNVNINKCHSCIKIIDFESQFYPCYVESHVTFINLQLRLLIEAKRQLNEDVRSCYFKQNVFQAEGDECIQELVLENKIKLFKIEKAVEIILLTEKVKRLSCIESTFIRLDNDMNDAAKDFNACVEVIMDAEVNLR